MCRLGTLHKALAPHVLCRITACLSLCQNGYLECIPAGAVANKLTFLLPRLGLQITQPEKNGKSGLCKITFLMQHAESLTHSLCHALQVAPGAAEQGSKRQSAAVLHVTAHDANSSVETGLSLQPCRGPRRLYLSPEVLSMSMSSGWKICQGKQLPMGSSYSNSDCCTGNGCKSFLVNAAVA